VTDCSNTPTAGVGGYIHTYMRVYIYTSLPYPFWLKHTGPALYFVLMNHPSSLPLDETNPSTNVVLRAQRLSAQCGPCVLVEPFSKEEVVTRSRKRLRVDMFHGFSRVHRINLAYTIGERMRAMCAGNLFVEQPAFLGPGKAQYWALVAHNTFRCYNDFNKMRRATPPLRPWFYQAGFHTQVAWKGRTTLQIKTCNSAMPYSSFDQNISPNRFNSTVFQPIIRCYSFLYF